MAYEFLAVGVALLFFGSESLLRGGIGIFKSFGLSPLLIGLVVVAAATSAPEFAVTMQALANKTPEMAVGSIIGADLINLLLLAGLGALIRPLPSPPKIAFRDGSAMLLSTVALGGIVAFGAFNRRTGLVLLAGFFAYLAVAFISDWRRTTQLSVSEARAQCREHNSSDGLNVFLIVLGIVSLFFGARCLVDGVLSIAPALHMTGDLAGLTIVALATALPEIVVVFGMTMRGWDSVTIGSLLATSIFNILAVLGIAALVHPFRLSGGFVHFDAYILAGTAVLLLPLMITSWRLTRWNGALLLLCYAGYCALLAARLGYLPMPFAVT